MSDVDTVAEAIYLAYITRISALPPKLWTDLSSAGQSTYRRMAQAAIDSLRLTEETFSGEVFETKSESGGEGVLRWSSMTETSKGYLTRRRLVSPWSPSLPPAQRIISQAL